MDAGNDVVAASNSTSTRARIGGGAESLMSRRDVTTEPNSAPQNEGVDDRALSRTVIASTSWMYE